MTDQKKLLHEFLGDAHVLIVESSSSFAANIQSCLTGMGVLAERIAVARRVEDAFRAINARKPKLFISEYEVEQKGAIRLIESLDEHHAESARIAIIATKNTSDAVIAEAAEGQIDAFIMKPFSVETFRQKLMQTVERKLRPSEYTLAIQTGKQSLTEGNIDAARTAFARAKTLDPKPTLACYYMGLAHQARGDEEQALASFREGRVYQALHYRCLLAEFETLIKLKRPAEAARLIAPLKENFPVGPKRLGQMFTVLVDSQHYDIILELYELYSQQDHRPPELVTTAAEALAVAGREALLKGNTPRAVELFERAVQVSGHQFARFDAVVSELLRVEALTEAQAFFKKAPPQMIGTAEYNRLSFKLDQFTANRDQLIDRGRKLVHEGQATPELYEIIVRLMAEEGKTTLAESVISRAVKQFPDIRVTLYKILETTPALRARVG